MTVDLVPVSSNVPAIPSPVDRPLRFLAYGGGTQSAALALMSAAGEIDRLDAVVMADTGGELPETYEYARYVNGVLERAGIPFLVVGKPNLEAALLGIERPVEGGGAVRIPAFTVDPEDGTPGKVRDYTCSYDYKRRQVRKATRALCGGRGAWKAANVEQWLGFSVDEIGRAKPEKDCRCGHVMDTHADGPCGNTKCRCERFHPWRVNRYPLLELGFRRKDTIRWFAEHGHPTPTRSACWFCPNQGDARWRDLKENRPELWGRAVAIDAAVRGGLVGGGQRFLHRARVPLPLVDLRSSAQRDAATGQDGLFDENELGLDCEAGVCFT